MLVIIPRYFGTEKRPWAKADFPCDESEEFPAFSGV